MHILKLTSNEFPAPRSSRNCQTNGDRWAHVRVEAVEDSLSI